MDMMGDWVGRNEGGGRIEREKLDTGKQGIIALWHHDDHKRVSSVFVLMWEKRETSFLSSVLALF